VSAARGEKRGARGTMWTMRSSTLVLSGLLMVSLGCGAAPVEPRAREEPSSSERAAPTTAVVWRRAGTKVLGVDGTRAFAWERAGESQNVIVATSVATGAELSRLPLEAAPYIGEPRAWWSIGEASVVHWHGLGRVQEGAAAWTAGAVTRPFSTSQPAPADTLLVADSYRVVRLRVDGEPLWTHELPRGAQPPEFYVDTATVGLAFQQYSTTSPTTQLSIPHRVRSISLHDGGERWTRDFTENLGAVHVRGDVLIIAQGADLVFLDGATGEERVRHPALGPPSIYPRIVSDDAHVVVALDPFVRAYDLRGALLWQTRGLGNGVRMVIHQGDLFASTADGTLVRVALSDGRLVWRVGTAIASGWVWATPSGVLVDSGAVRAGVALPLERVVPERARVRGRVELGTCEAGDVQVGAQSVLVTPAADGSFTLEVESVGFVGVTASRTNLEESESELRCPESSVVVALDGSAEYAVSLSACCDGRGRRSL
jgi:outer membrane protein assembly factor BamB